MAKLHRRAENVAQNSISTVPTVLWYILGKEGKVGRFVVQVNLIITLFLGSMKTEHVISEPCYNEVIYNRHIVK